MTASDESAGKAGTDRSGSAEQGADETGPDGRAVGDAGVAADSGHERALERVRTEPRPHAVAVGVAVVLGVALSWVHWIGLVLGGALVGLVAPTLRRAVVGAAGFGLLVLAVFAVSLGGSTWRVLEMTPVVYLTAAGAVGLALLGSLVRGVV